ncbi:MULTISPECIES: biopolymer transporter Tol [Curtobacterium]|uniref:biopolymer transporter Tol n=1 Tax=Curtobacterium TaxID=2034 RepID=UPI0018E54785|nr:MULTISPECIES: biopolymer transporter Tol [Curtobacterium]MCA5924982.1 biopolymer transporter Tol [Curtobacterium oceanosedimentum]QQD75343.1 biopolymer transporter Tol [Curtobacterium sp. YC1]
MNEPRGRQLLPGQTSRVHVYDLERRTSRLVFESSTLLVEAPNVLPDGRLLLNGGGDLWLLEHGGTAVDESALVPVPMPGVPEINNDHVLDPSGTSVVVSGRDGDLYRVPVPLGGAAATLTDVTTALPVVRKFYLHGIAPDGETLAAIVGEHAEDGTWTTDVALVDPATGDPTFLTRDEHPDDGVSFAGDLLVWNSERFTPGTAQLVALWPGATDPVRITNDDRVNWFPHVSPDGAHLLYLSYEPGVQGHPADHRVELRLLPGSLVRGARIAVQPETLVTLDGGQGTVNVPPWSPDSRWFAYCDYPVAG